MADFNSRLPVKNLGIYNASDNIDPANIGIILHVRAASPADTDSTIRHTGARPNVDNIDPANIWASDVNTFLHGYDGAAWDRITATGGALDVNIQSSDIVVNVDVDGIYDAGTNTNPDNIGIIAHTRNITPGDTQQTIRLTGINNSTVWALDVSLHDENGAAFSSSNPLPVVVLESEGVEVNNHNEGVDVAAGASSNHDYTVTALKTLQLTQISASGSGKAKFEIKIETGVATNTYTTYFVFFNSTSDPNVIFSLKEPIAVAAGVRVRVTRTNRDNQPASIYTTISGHEV